MKRFALIPIVALVLLVGAGATAGMIAASEAPPESIVQVQAVEKHIQNAPIPPAPALSISSNDGTPPRDRETPSLQYPNLGSALDQMATAVDEEEYSSREADGGTSQPEPVAVTIYLSGHVEDVVTFLEDNGGDPRNVGEDYIEAYVPVSLLGELSGQPGVLRVREIIPPVSN